MKAQWSKRDNEKTVKCSFFSVELFGLCANLGLESGGKGWVRVSGEGGGEGSTLCTIYNPLRRELASRI